MNRYYVIPDIHGRKDLLDITLEEIYQENPNGGKIIFLGDYIDMGPDGLGVLLTVMNPPKNWEFVCLKGNHEDMMTSYQVYDHRAVRQITEYEKFDDIFKWMQSLKLFHWEDSNVFAHASYEPSLTEDEQSVDDLLWHRYTDEEDWQRHTNTRYYLTHGHTPKRNGPIMSPLRCNLDTGAVFTGRLHYATFEKGKQGPQEFRYVEILE